MAPLAVRKREGDNVVAPAAPFAIYYPDHRHVVLSLGGDEYLRMADLAFKPVCVHLMRVDDIVDEVALRGDEHIHLEGRHLGVVRHVERELGVDELLPYDLRPVDEAVPVLGQPDGREGLRVPADALLVRKAGRLVRVSDAGRVSLGVEVDNACGVTWV